MENSTAERIPRVLTAQEAATYLRITPATLYKLIHKGEIPAAKVGRQWRFHLDLLDEWLVASGKNNAAK